MVEEAGSGRFIDHLDWLLKRGLVTMSVDEDSMDGIALTSKGMGSYYRFVEWVKETLEKGVKI
jgi:hypothetical protein